MLDLKHLFNLYFILTLLSLSLASTNLETLHSAQIIFRHGARTMDRTIPTDPYKDESFWPDGYHQLTCIGKTQGYLLGQFIRKRYEGYISKKYSPKEIRVLSSDMDRCIQTADSVLAGLYSNINIRENNEDCSLINWTAIPIHSIPEEYDNVLRQYAACPKFDKLLNNSHKTDRSSFEKLLMHNLGHKFIMDFATNVGLELSKAPYYLDALMIQNYYNFTLPEWTKPLFTPPASDNIVLAFFKTFTKSDEMKRLRAGPAWEKLLKNFNQTMKPAKDKQPKKLNLFSAHDYTLGSIMDVLGIYTSLTIPRFASALFLELHRSPSKKSHTEPKDFEIEIYFRNENHGDSFAVEIPGCGTPCSYEKFLEIVSPFVPDDWKKECQDNLDSSGYYSYIPSGMSWCPCPVSTFAAATLVILLAIYYCQKQSKSKTL